MIESIPFFVLNISKVSKLKYLRIGIDNVEKMFKILVQCILKILKISYGFMNLTCTL